MLNRIRSLVTSAFSRLAPAKPSSPKVESAPQPQAPRPATELFAEDFVLFGDGALAVDALATVSPHEPPPEVSGEAHTAIPRKSPYQFMGPTAAAIAQTNALIGNVRSEKRAAKAATWWLYKRLELKEDGTRETPSDAAVFFGKTADTHVREGMTSTGHPIVAVWNGPPGIEPPTGDSPHAPYWG